MDKALDMSLDDIIKSKKGAGRGRGRGGAPRGRGGARVSFSGGRMRGVGRGAGRQGALGVNTRQSSFAIAKSFRRSKTFPWQHDLFEESLAAAGIPAMENGTKLCISNLDAGVSNDDIRELFSEIGELKRYGIHFDKNGQPSGSAEVVYGKRSDAFAAHKRYNNVQLDGRPMRIEIVSPNSGVPVAARVNVVGGTNGKATRRVVMMQTGGRSTTSAQTNRGAGQRTRGGLRNGQRNGQGRTQMQSRGMHRGQARGRGWGRGKKRADKSAEDLDKELENYHAEGMQIAD